MLNGRIIVVLVISCFYFSPLVAQMYKSSYQVGVDVPLSFMDANTKAGLGIRGGYRYAVSDKVGLGSSFFVNRLAGGAILSKNFKDPDNTGLFFSSNVVGISAAFDYNISIGKKKYFEVGPVLEIGGLAYNTTGGFFNSEVAVNLYNRWGDDYFVPIRESGEVIDAEMNASGLAATVSPSIRVAYNVTFWLKVYASTGYVFTNTDKLDGFFIPIDSNDDNDLIQQNHVGISIKLKR